MLYGKWSKRCREATHEKDVLQTWNTFSPQLSSLKDLYGTVRSNFPKCEFSNAKNLLFEEEILLEVKQNNPTMLFISIPSADLCVHQKIEENVNGRAIFVIVVVKR